MALLPTTNIAEYKGMFKMTLGELDLNIEARKQRLLAARANKSGDTGAAAAHNDAANAIQVALNAGLHNPTTVLAAIGGGQGFSNSIHRMISAASRRSQKAMNPIVRNNATNGLAGLELNTEEMEECLAEAQRLTDIEIERNSFRDIRIQRQFFTQKYNECRIAKENEKLVVEKLEEAGVNLLYDVMPSGGKSNWNAEIRDKWALQNSWVSITSRETGVPRDRFTAIMDNGVLNETELTSAEIKDKLAYEMREPGRQAAVSQAINNGQNGFLSVAILIATLIAAAVKAGNQILSFIQTLSGRQQDLYSNLLDPSGFGPAEEDFNNNGKDDATETSLDKITAPGPLTILAGAAIGIGGNFLPKPQSDNFFVQNWNWVLGGIFAGIGAFQVFFPTKRWIVFNNSYTAEEMVGLGYVQYNGEWYLAASVSEKSTLDIDAIKNGGKELFDTIKSIFDLIKGNPTTTPDGPEFVGDNQLAGGSLDQLDQEGD